MYGAAELGIVAVNRTSGPVSAGWTLIAVAALALALAGCGRKGPLDLPPTAAGPLVEQGDTGEDTNAAADALIARILRENGATP